MQLSHTPRAVSAVFDDPNLVSAAGLVPIVALAEQAGLRSLADEHLSVPTDKGANAGLKVASLVAGMVAGADSIDDLGLLRHGGMDRVFERAYAPSTLGSFLRAFTFGHVRQLDAVASRFLTGLPIGRRWWPGPTSPTVRSWSTSTTPSSRSTAMANRDRVTATPGSAGLNVVLATVSTRAGRAGDRGATTPPRCLWVTARRGTPGRRRAGDGEETARYRLARSSRCCGPIRRSTGTRRCRPRSGRARTCRSPSASTSA